MQRLRRSKSGGFSRLNATFYGSGFGEELCTMLGFKLLSVPRARYSRGGAVRTGVLSGGAGAPLYPRAGGAGKGALAGLAEVWA